MDHILDTIYGPYKMVHIICYRSMQEMAYFRPIDWTIFELTLDKDKERISMEEKETETYTVNLKIVNVTYIWKFDWNNFEYFWTKVGKKLFRKIISYSTGSLSYCTSEGNWYFVSICVFMASWKPYHIDLIAISRN